MRDIQKLISTKIEGLRKKYFIADILHGYAYILYAVEKFKEYLFDEDNRPNNFIEDNNNILDLLVNIIAITIYSAEQTKLIPTYEELSNKKETDHSMLCILLSHIKNNISKEPKQPQKNGDYYFVSFTKEQLDIIFDILKNIQEKQG